MGKILVLVSTILCCVITMFADFSVFNHSFVQGELVCLVWLVTFMVSVIISLMEGK